MKLMSSKILLYTCTTEGPGITHVSTRNGVEVQDNMHIYTRKCSVNYSWFKFCIQPLSIEQLLMYYDANVHEVSIYVIVTSYTYIYAPPVEQAPSVHNYPQYIITMHIDSVFSTGCASPLSHAQVATTTGRVQVELCSNWKWPSLHTRPEERVWLLLNDVQD